MTDPVVMPFIRLVPLPDRVWTDEDRDQALRALEHARQGFASAGYMVGWAATVPGYGRCAHATVSALESARWELDRLLDRIATVDMGVDHSDL